jgi:hypothetical protein
LRGRFPCHRLALCPNALARPVGVCKWVHLKDSRASQERPDLNWVSMWISDFFRVFGYLERSRNKRTFDLEAFLSHRVQKQTLYLPLMQRNLVWIARRRSRHIRHAPYELRGRKVSNH